MDRKKDSWIVARQERLEMVKGKQNGIKYEEKDESRDSVGGK